MREVMRVASLPRSPPFFRNHSNEQTRARSLASRETLRRSRNQNEIFKKMAKLAR